MADRLKHARPLCYNAEFGRYYVKGVGVTIGRTQKHWGALGPRPFGRERRAWPLQTRPHMDYRSKLITVGQTVREYVRRSAEKLGFCVPPLKAIQGQRSSDSELTRIDRLLMMSY